jgi:hypothetical protein
MNESDSDRMPLERHPMTIGERRDAQVKALEDLCELLTLQMAELALGQQASVKRSTELTTKLTGMEEKLAENTAVTSEVLEIMSAAKMGFRVLGWVGTFVKFAGGAAAGFIALWALWHAVNSGSPFPPGDK